MLTTRQDLFLSVLNSTSTKREAKSYLSRFDPNKSPSKRSPTQSQSTKKIVQDCIDYNTAALHRSGVNLGSLYGPPKAVENAPLFSLQSLPESPQLEGAEPMHVALVKIRAPESLDDETLRGIGLTLSQLTLLGLSSAVIVHHDPSDRLVAEASGNPNWRRSILEQADRIMSGIEDNGSHARRLDNLISVPSASDSGPTGRPVGELQVLSRNQLLAPFKRGIIPVICPIGYTIDNLRAVPVSPNEVVLALTRELAGFSKTMPDESPTEVVQRIRARQSQVSLDKLIILDPLGGIPSPERRQGSHIFINLEQEFKAIRAELISGHTSESSSRHSPSTDTVFFQTSSQFSQQPLNLADTDVHVRNLDLLQRTLALLPPASSALLTTPEEAANSRRLQYFPDYGAGVGTRRPKNPLIYNLLTDKPAVSSSLPDGRLGQNPLNFASTNAAPTTFVKRGMPLTILPKPGSEGWTPPEPGAAPLGLDDARIDLPRLIHLVEDSFDRKLDVEHYLSRVNGRIAGIIIAGEYEGGALLTWETAAGTGRRVPYLDKFAVLKRSQGAGGVADVLFKAMVRTCLPSGVCWRSRRDNPVNKWYFERARGAWKMADSDWTMFWTTPGLDVDGRLFEDYEHVCRSVEPSWADRKHVLG